MTVQHTLTKSKAGSLARWREVIVMAALFLLALGPRGLALQHFVTADEAKWVYRSAQFLGALLRGDYAATAVNLTPAVTTTWLGSLGLLGYYQLHRAEIGLPFGEWLDTLPQFRADLSILAAARWPMVILTSLAVIVIYWLARRLWGGPIAFLGALLIALDAHTISLSRIIGHDAPVAIFMTLSLLALLLAVAGNAPRSVFKPGWLVVSGLLAGLAFLSKSPAFFLLPFTALLLLVKAKRSSHFNSAPPGPPKGGERSPIERSDIPPPGPGPLQPDQRGERSPTERGDVPPSGGLGGLSPLKSGLKLWSQGLILWGLLAYGVFVLLWPAAWVAPLRQPFAVVENAFLSATNLDEVVAGEEVERESYWLVPDLGPFYYLVNGALKLNPLVMLGLLLGSWLAFRQAGANARSGRVTRLLNGDEFWLGLFALLFLVFLTLGGKRSNRYILPIFPPLAFLAAVSWYRFGLAKKFIIPPESGSSSIFKDCPICTTPYVLHTLILAAGALLVSALTLLPYVPYYYTYFNPLLGGPLLAPRLVKIGWGEGLDEAGRWLERQPDSASSRAGSWYASSLAPFYRGDIAAVSSDRLDYVVLYLKQVQSGLPRPEIGQYFAALEPLHTIHLAGIEYARIYPGPAAQLSPASTAAITGLVAFRPQTNYAPIGGDLTLDLIWAADARLPETGPTIGLQWEEITLAQTETFSQPFDALMPVRRYRLSLPFDLPPGPVTLLADDQPLGHIQAYHIQAPADFTPIEISFADQVQLVGFDPRVALEGDALTVGLAFKANPKAWADYTIFVHLINAAGERLSGHDAPPTPPTSLWAKDQVVQVTHTLALPPDVSPAETYRLRVGLYHSQTSEPLGGGVVLPLEVRLP